MNPESYRFVSSLRTEFPRIEVTVIDSNRKDFMTKFYGDEISKLLKKLHKERGVKFVQKRKLLKLEGKDRKIESVKLKGKDVETDYVVLFPNNFFVDTELIRDNPKFRQSLRLEDNGQIRTSYMNNGGSKRVFVAGDASSIMNISLRERYRLLNPHRRINEGVYAAYNILGLVRNMHHFLENLITLALILF